MKNLAGRRNTATLSADASRRDLERLNSDAPLLLDDQTRPTCFRHIEELKAGHIIALIKVPADRIAEIATQNGARRLVYFGFPTVTWLTK